MTDVYVCKMWLSCDKNDPVSLKKLDERFPPALMREWEVLVFAGTLSEAQLKAKLDGKVWDGYQAYAAGDLQGATGSTTHQNTAWAIGTGGQHEGHEMALLSQGGVSTNWVIPGTGGARMEVHTLWAKVSVIP